MYTKYLTLIIFVTSTWTKVIETSPLLRKDQLETEDLPPKGFGKFYITIRYIKECSFGIIDTLNWNISNLTVIKHNETDEEFSGHVYIPNTQIYTKAKFTPMVLRNSVYKITFNKTIINPCSNILTSIPLAMMYNTDESCTIKKGNYTIKSLNPTKWAYNILGENFMFERIQVITEYFSTVGSIFCTQVVGDIRPFPKLRKHYGRKH